MVLKQGYHNDQVTTEGAEEGYFHRLEVLTKNWNFSVHVHCDPVYPYLTAWQAGKGGSAN